MAQRGHRAYAQLGPVWGASGVEVEPKTGPMRATMVFARTPVKAKKTLEIEVKMLVFSYRPTWAWAAVPTSFAIWGQSDVADSHLPHLGAKRSRWTPNRSYVMHMDAQVTCNIAQLGTLNLATASHQVGPNGDTTWGT
jgi:hypothetical protein